MTERVKMAFEPDILVLPLVAILPLKQVLAKALNLNIANIKRRQKMLDGICPEVIELLKDKAVNRSTFDELRKMKPGRQIEAAELMVTAGNFTANYAKARIIATRSRDLVDPDRPKKAGGMTPDEMAQMQREMENLHRHFKAIEAGYGDDVLNLVIATGYVAKLVGNPAIERYLERYHPEIVSEFRSIIAAASLDQASAAA